MGMFDELRCLFPLPVTGANAATYQTKDTARQGLDQYEIREDGSLWVEEYDYEDRSDPKAEGWQRFVGSLTKVNRRWVPASETGAIRFYTFWPNDNKVAGWLEWEALFDAGKLVRPPKLITLEYAPGAVQPQEGV